MQWTIDTPVFEDGSPEARVVEWHRTEGDLVEADTLLLEIETQKAVYEIVSPKTGYLQKRSAAAGDMVKTKATLAILTDKKP